jgi:integrase/recombinase XerC
MVINKQFAISIFDNLDVRDSTINDYKYRINYFLQFINDNGINADAILNYKRHLAGIEYYSVSTKNKYLICAKIFMRECYRRGLIPIDLTLSTKTFSQSKKHKVFGLDDNDIEKVCLWIKCNPLMKRERALLALLMLQGLRQCEICRLKTDDIRLASSVMMVQGKGSDDSEAVYLHPMSVELLSEYIKIVSRQNINNNSYLFQSKSRSTCTGKLTERGLRKIIMSILIEIGITKNVHGFRHYYTTKLIKSMPGELTTVASFTRHKSLEMLQTYNDEVIGQKHIEKFINAFNDLPL